MYAIRSYYGNIRPDTEIPIGQNSKHDQESKAAMKSFYQLLILHFDMKSDYFINLYNIMT